MDGMHSMTQSLRLGLEAVPHRIDVAHVFALICTGLEVINTCDETDRPGDSVATSFALPSGFERISKSGSALDWSSCIPVNTYHRLHGRIVPVLFTLHAILYLNSFAASGILLTRLQAPVLSSGILQL